MGTLYTLVLDGNRSGINTFVILDQYRKRETTQKSPMKKMENFL